MNLAICVGGHLLAINSADVIGVDQQDMGAFPVAEDLVICTGAAGES